MATHYPYQCHGSGYADIFRVTMTMLYTGDHDDVPTFWFYGTVQDLMQRVCQTVIKWCHGYIQKLVLSPGMLDRPRNGLCRRYYSVEVHGLQTRYMSVKDVGIIFQRALLKECPCRVVQHPFARFINM